MQEKQDIGLNTDLYVYILAYYLLCSATTWVLHPVLWTAFIIDPNTDAALITKIIS